MRNIGKVSRRWLHEAGIETVEDLKVCGVVSTYKMIKSVQSGVTLNLLWALEGTIEDRDWKDITEERKQQLLEELDK